MKINTKQIGFRVCEKEYVALEKLAKKTDSSISRLMRELIRKFLQNNKD